jgi:acyl-CoA dehydrogenase
LLEQCVVLIELGRSVAPVPYLASIVLGASAVARFGTQKQREQWAAPAARGDLVLTVALESAEDPIVGFGAITAERVAGRWQLTGTATTVPAGPYADLLLIPADTPDGPITFLVTPTDPGVTIQRQRLVNGDSAGYVCLSGVELTEDRELGGSEVSDWLLARGKTGLCAQQLGVVERALELTAEYARTRIQFDRPIGSFQAVAQRLADAYIDVEAIRLTMWQAAWRLSTEMPYAAEVATAKFWAADGGHRVAHTAVHIHGGVGIDVDYPLHRYFVAAKYHEFALGNATSQLRAIGAGLAQATVRPLTLLLSDPMRPSEI